MLLGKSQEFPPLSSVSNGIHEVFQSTLLDVGDGVFYKSLVKDKPHQVRFETLISEFTETLQNTGDSQVVMLGPGKKKSTEFRMTEQERKGISVKRRREES